MKKLGNQDWKTQFNISPIFPPTVSVAVGELNPKLLDEEANAES